MYFFAEHCGHFLFPPPSSAGRGPNEKGAGGVTKLSEINFPSFKPSSIHCFKPKFCFLLHHPIFSLTFLIFLLDVFNFLCSSGGVQPLHNLTEASPTKGLYSALCKS